MNITSYDEQYKKAREYMIEAMKNNPGREDSAVNEDLSASILNRTITVGGIGGD